MGRRKVFYLSSGCTLLSGLGYGLAFDYYMFVFFRFCVGFSSIGAIASSYVLSVELVGMSTRSFAGVLGSFMFGLAYPMVAVVAYFVRQWRVLILLLTGIGVGLFSLWK